MVEPARQINFNEQDISDKPRWVRQHDELDMREVRRLDELRRRQYQTLLGVDDAVGRIMMTLTDTGRLADTALFLPPTTAFSWASIGFRRRRRRMKRPSAFRCFFATTHLDGPAW